MHLADAFIQSDTVHSGYTFVLSCIYVYLCIYMYILYIRVCVCVCVHVYVVYEDTNLYNDMGMT